MILAQFEPFEFGMCLEDASTGQSYLVLDGSSMDPSHFSSVKEEALGKCLIRTGMCFVKNLLKILDY